MFEDIEKIFLNKLRKEYETLPIDFGVLVRIELGLLLLEKLNLQNQTPLNIWAIVQGIQIPGMKELYQSEDYRHWIANFRILNRFQTGLYNWQEDLKQYALLPVKSRLFELDSSKPFEEQTVVRTNNALHRLASYEEVLEGRLPFDKHDIHPAVAGEITFQIHEYEFTCNLSEEVIEQAKTSQSQFDFEARRVIQPRSYTYQQLFTLAKEMDNREEELLFPKRSNWEKRLKNINIRVFKSRRLSKANSKPIVIDGDFHIPGTVNSGKSTLMTIIAYDFAKENKGLVIPHSRVTLIVGDVAETLKLSNYLNTLLCKWDEKPVAVPILGHSQKEKHLNQFYRLAATNSHQRHWAFRFLNTACPLYGAIDPDQYETVLNIPGLEPCNHISQRKERKRRDGSIQATYTRCYCPFFYSCPSQQSFLDLGSAPIWITTPGALGSSKVPPQLSERSLRIWELVYEQSDLVIFDEVDSVQMWFDQVFSPEVLLENGRNGVFNETSRKVAEITTSDFRINKTKYRWYLDQHTSVTAGQHILYLVENYAGIEKWLSEHSFTALRLLYRLSEELSGVTSSPAQLSTRDQIKVRDNLNNLFLTALELIRNRNKQSENKRVQDLLKIVDSILSDGNSGISEDTGAFCKSWISKVFIENSIPEKNANEIELFSKKLELALSVAILDQRIHGMFGNWPSVSDLVGIPGDYGISQQMPAELLGILPLPPLGSTYGFVCPEVQKSSGTGSSALSTRLLATYEYASVGRFFIHNFHRLLSDIDGLRGPNVIAFSGTSWMPSSSKWHFGGEPKAILEPPEENQKAIGESIFTFWPQREEVKKQAQAIPINISGEETMRANLQKLTRQLVEKPSVDRAPLFLELKELNKLCNEKPRLWEDRERILLIVNSYDQVRDVANTIAKYAHKDLRSSVMGLVRKSETNADNDYYDLYDPMERGDIESFRETDAKVLVAPMAAIGRGYNILNRQGVAAIGSIFFLVRPMPQPFNMQEIVTEMNQNLIDFCNDPWNLKKPLHLIKGKHTLFDEMLALQKASARVWALAENRQGYQSLNRNQRKQLAANTLGVIVQSCGRLLRGGVPFRAHFVDAKWAPNSAQEGEGRKDTPNESLLMAMIEELRDICQHPVGKVLYGSISEAMNRTFGLK